MEIKNKYWKGLEELNRDPQFVKESSNEFYEGLPLDEALSKSGESLDLSSNRRDFLKYFGFSVSAVALAACNTTPVKNVIPYVVKPQEINPGIPNYYASSFNGTPVVVKTREGRPIKIDGNEKSKLSGGGLDSIGQASILALYDTLRTHKPLKGGKPSDWKTIDGEISSKLASIAAANGGIAILTPTINSPSTLAVIADFKAKYPTTTHVQYDALSYSGIIKGNEMCFGKAIVPSYAFDKAEVIVSFGADFLGTWVSPNEFSYQWSKNRNLRNGEKTMSRHYQFEAMLSLTGSNADVRMPMKPSDEGAAIITLHNEIAKLAGAGSVGRSDNKLAGGAITKAAQDLWKSKGKSLVVSGSNNPNIQAVVNYINSMLGNYGTTIDLDNACMSHNATDDKATQLLKDLNSGAVKAIIVYNTNPVYTHNDAKAFGEAIKKAQLSVAVGLYADETALACTYNAPDHHFLESWGDHESRAGYYSLVQPTINPVMESRQFQSSLLTWSGAASADYYEYVKAYWEKNMFAKQTAQLSFTNFWNESLPQGIFDSGVKPSVPASITADLASIVAKVESVKGGGIELVVYESTTIGDGTHANNPILQEIPDPISKVTWDNYVAISKSNADALNVKEGDLLKVSSNGYAVTLPLVIQPGQARDTIAIALGYGRKAGEGVKEKIGENAYPFRTLGADGYMHNFRTNVTVEKAAGSYELARTQTHNSIEGRDIVRETNLPAFNQDRSKVNHDHHSGIRDKKRNDQLYTLWTEHDNKGHKWAMAIDLNACTGCSSCIVSCNIENNVPVVGRDEVRRRREMHWLRIDRYYRFAPHIENPDDATGYGFTETGDIGLKYTDHPYKDKPEYFDNVSVVHMPMLCQHCGHAPCETVCPVLATTHSSEGLNQMTYNRCIGTKYCANNCPYKVRRFNWFRYNDNSNFDYYLNNDLGKMVINPDVTVRTRGVMEKCSFCVQRIQYAKLQAKLEKRKIKDGEVKMACQQSCPTGAIVFGDLKDPDSEISRLYRNERSYHVLEELNVQSSIVYMAKIWNTETPAAGSAKKEEQHAH